MSARQDRSFRERDGWVRGCLPAPCRGRRPAMYDKNSYYGGHTASFRYESGFLFDVGPHISFTKDPRIQELFADSVDQRYETIPINLNNYWSGTGHCIPFNSISTECRKTSS